MFNNEFGAKVDRMKSVYRGNPEKLKQSSGINADLSKLMAYQSMISERQALENEAVLRREQQPSSLVEQYENKLVQGNVDNMKSRAARVGGIPQNLQQPPMAQGAPQGAAQGIASQPRPNMQGMAQGGIVGYYAGGTITADELAALGMDSASFEALPERSQDALLKNLKASKGSSPAQRDAMRTRLAQPVKNIKQATSGISGALTAIGDIGMAVTGAGGAAAPADPADPADPVVTADPADPVVTTEPVGTGTVLKADPEEVVADPKKDVKTPEEKAAALAEAKKTYKGKSPTQAALDEFGIPSVLTDVKRSTETPIADGLGRGVVDAKKAQAAGDPTAQAAAERTRLTKEREALGIDAEYQRQIDAQKALDAKATDPAARKKADRDAILRGMALGGVRGSTLAQNRLATNRSEGEQTRLDRMSKMNTDKNTAKFEMLKDIDSRAAEAYSTYAKVQTDAFNSLVGLTEAELGNMEENFKNNVLYKQGEIENVLTAANLTVANTMKEIAQGSLDLNRTVQAQISATNAIGTINTEMRKSQDLERNRAQVNLTDPDPAIKAAAEKKLAQLDNDILVAQAPMLQLVKTLTDRMAKLK
tara:strand:- start:1345 stop:3123 length:1779 start_codon:yes stop_codon:yes gene_type:complete